MEDSILGVTIQTIRRVAFRTEEDVFFIPNEFLRDLQSELVLNIIMEVLNSKDQHKDARIATEFNGREDHIQKIVETVKKVGVH